MNQHIKISKILCVYHNHFSTGLILLMEPVSDTTVGFRTIMHSGNYGISESSNNKILPLKESNIKKNQVKEITLEDRFTDFSFDRYWVVANHSDPQARTPPRYPHKIIFK